MRFCLSALQIFIYVKAFFWIFSESHAVRQDFLKCTTSNKTHNRKPRATILLTKINEQRGRQRNNKVGALLLVWPSVWHKSGVCKLSSKRARFDGVNMHEGRPFCLVPFFDAILVCCDLWLHNVVEDQMYRHNLYLEFLSFNLLVWLLVAHIFTYLLLSY